MPETNKQKDPANEEKPKEKPEERFMYQLRPPIGSKPKKLRKSRSASGDGGTAANEQELPLEKRAAPFNSFVHENVEHFRFSPDGRFAYGFATKKKRLVVVDLLLNTQRAFKPKKRKWESIQDIVAVNPATLIVLDSNGLCLLRLSTTDDSFEFLPMQGFEDSSLAVTVVLTSISGANVAVEQAVLHSLGNRRLRFVRADVDAVRVDGDEVAAVEDPSHVFHLSNDGGSLFATSRSDLRHLHALALSTGEWTKHETSGEIDGNWVDRKLYWTRDHAFFCGREFVNGAFRWSVFRCDLERREWTKQPLTMAARNVDRIVSIATESGEDGGMLVVTSEKHDETIVYRLLKTPDSLVHLAAAALRKSHIDVKGEHGFHECMKKTACNKLIPMVFSNLKPIPRI
ncbi:hypothetical protein M3Y99_01597500 [Aphelenchoides fujianensis]|nr:hypothetical protein M3Y99_01597500 [Aphelenchoides fujianensis]